MTSKENRANHSTLITDVFGLNLSQKELDFINLDLSEDLRLYVDPILLYRSPHKEFNEAHALISHFFNQAIIFVKEGRPDRAEEMCHFPDAENRLGLSSTGVGHGPRKQLGTKIFNELVKNKDIQEHGLKFLSEFQLLIEGISFDLISDATVHISKSVFIKYTQEQCRLHGIKLHSVIIGNVFNWDDFEWDSVRVDLPVNPLKDNEPFLLTPKTVARRYPECDYREFYEEIYKNILLSQEKSRLWKALGKEPKVSLSDIADKYKNKKAVVGYIAENPSARRDFLAQIKPALETAWIEQLSLVWDRNVNQIITPDIIEMCGDIFPDWNRDRGRITAVTKAAQHQLNLIRPKLQLIPEIEAMIKACKQNTILLLGNYGPGGTRLDKISEMLKGFGYRVLMVRDINTTGESLREKVARLATLARFVVIEDSYPGGQISEIEILRSIGAICVIIRETGRKSTFMTAGISFNDSNFMENEYSVAPIEQINRTDIKRGLAWAEDRLRAQNEFWDKKYPW